MSIYIGNKKAIFCKGDSRPANLYKGDRRLCGAVSKTFSGKDLVIPGTYNDKVQEIVINGAFVDSRNIFDLSMFSETFPALTNEEPISGYGVYILDKTESKAF